MDGNGCVCNYKEEKIEKVGNLVKKLLKKLVLHFLTDQNTTIWTHLQHSWLICKPDFDSIFI